MKQKEMRTPANICRVAVFSPTKKPVSVTRKITTGWGDCCVTGRLGTNHHRLVDTLLDVATDREETTDGRVHLLIDPAKVRSSLGWDKFNYNMIESLIKDLRDADVEMFFKKEGEKVSYGVGKIIAEFDKLNLDVPRVNARSVYLNVHEGSERKTRKYWGFEFGKGWSLLIKDDIHMFKYPYEVVAGLRFGVSQSVALFCHSHRDGRYRVKTLTDLFGCTERLDKSMRSLRADVEALATIGVHLDHEHVVYVRNS